MGIAGKIIQALSGIDGISKAGNEWKRQEYVLEAHDQYPKKVCFQIFGADKITQATIQPGGELTVFFDIDSREYQGRWFTSINVWKVDCLMAAVPQATPMGVTPDNFAPASVPTVSTSPAPDSESANPVDGLPS